MKLSLLDHASLAVDSARRPATFTIIAHLDGARPDPDRLSAGALRAMATFSRSRSFVRGHEWMTTDQPPFEIECSEVPSSLEGFVSRPTDPFRFPLLHQLLCPSAEGRWMLATRMHHVMGDGIALLLWLSEQLREQPAGRAPALRVRRSPRQPVAWSKTRSLGPAALGTGISPQKNWRTLWMDASLLEKAATGATLNDLLCSRIFSAIRAWCGDGGRPLSLWIPMNLRRDPFAHFVNASSRIRLREAHDPRGVRTRVREALAQGGWDPGNAAHPMAPGSMISRVPACVLRAGLSLYFGRPGMDPCTSAFSFVSRVSRDDERVAFPGVSRMETIGHLHEAHSFAFSATRFGGTLGLTLFWDPASVQGDEIFGSLLKVCRE